MILSNQISLLSAILTLTPTPEVHAHGYLKSPRSRNYFAHTDGLWWGGTASDPRPENCPHCLNIGGTEGRCGVIESRNYDYPKNSFGGDLAPVIQACYQPGAVVEFEVRKRQLYLYSALLIMLYVLTSSVFTNTSCLGIAHSLSHGSYAILRLPHFSRTSPNTSMLWFESSNIHFGWIVRSYSWSPISRESIRELDYCIITRLFVFILTHLTNNF